MGLVGIAPTGLVMVIGLVASVLLPTEAVPVIGFHLGALVEFGVAVLMIVTWMIRVALAG